MTLKRMAAILVVLMMVATSLVGCSQSSSLATSNTSTMSPNSSSTTSATVTTAAQETTPATNADTPLGKYDTPVTITMARGMDSTAQFDENNPEKKSYSENRWITAYQEHLNIKVEYKWIATDNDSGKAKWSTAIASGDVPDAAIVDDATYKLLLQSNMIADMTSIYDQYVSPAYKACTTDTNIQQMWYNDALRGLPYATKAFHGASLLFVRKDWLDKLGLPIPKTIGDVVTTAKAFSNAKLGGDKTIGILFGNGTTIDGKWDGFMNGYGAYLDYWLKKDGSLVYSDTQNEMKDALLGMQALYRDGIMNKDFAVTTGDLATEYVAGGKVGLFYAYAWDPFVTILSLYQNDKSADIINVYPPSVSGEPIPIQTNSPITWKISVSTSCKHPEAVVKMVNLSIDLADNDPEHYYVDLNDNGFTWYKYLPWGDCLKPVTYEIDKANAIRVAEETGVKKFYDSAVEADYNTYLLSKEGKAPASYKLSFGPNGSFTTLYDALHNNLQLINAYNGLPTDTMSLKGDVIDDGIKTAMMNVIMGADISVYENAIKAWYTNGGQAMTDEVNQWYQTSKKD